MFKFSLKKIIIGIVVLVILAVLIVNWDKNMLYGDTFYPISRFHIEKLFYNWQIITTDIYFGGDNSEYISGKELNNILLYLPQILNSVLYYVITFLLSFLYIQTIFNKKKYLLIRIFSATLLTFNVFSVFFNGLIGFNFIYPALIGFLWISYKIFTANTLSIFSIFLFTLFVHIVSGYPRMIGIAIILLILQIYFIFLQGGLKIKVTRFLLLCFILILTNLPFILTYFFKFFFSGETNTFDNYISSYIDWGTGYYNSLKSDGFLSTIVLKEPYNFFGADSYRALLFKIISIFLIFGLPIIFLLNQSCKKIRSIYIIYIGIIFLIGSAIFVPSSIFVEIFYQIFPIFANAVYWMSPLLFIILIWIIIGSSSLRYNRIFSYIGIIFYSGYVFFTLISPYEKNTNWIEYKNGNLFNQIIIGDLKGATVYCPSDSVLLSGATVPLPTKILSNNMSVVNSDPRTATNSEKVLSAKLADLSLDNKSFFDINNFIIYKGNFQSTENYSFYNDQNYNNIKERCLNYVHSHDFKKIIENDYVVVFSRAESEKYNHFLYSPASILSKDLDSFFSGSIDIYKKPINIDPLAFQKPVNIETWIIPPENQNISIRYKQSHLQPTKIYTNIAHFDSTKPFLLHLNQTFGMSWKLKWITQEEFESHRCIDEYKEFSITQNKVCQFVPRILDISDVKYLTFPNVSDKNHFEGNFIGNTWLIKPSEIPENMRGQKELYAVIIYEKQIWYTCAILISGITFLILLFLTVNQGTRRYFQKKKALKKS